MVWLVIFINYNCLVENELWICPEYNILQNAEMFPFGLESTSDFNNITMSNSMKTVEVIPEFETNSEILKVLKVVFK